MRGRLGAVPERASMGMEGGGHFRGQRSSAFGPGQCPEGMWWSYRQPDSHILWEMLALPRPDGRRILGDRGWGVARGHPEELTDLKGWPGMAWPPDLSLTGRGIPHHMGLGPCTIKKPSLKSVRAAPREQQVTFRKTGLNAQTGRRV